MLSTALRNIGGIFYSTLEVNSSIYIIQNVQNWQYTQGETLFLFYAQLLSVKCLTFCNTIDNEPACYKEFNPWGLVTLIFFV